MLSSEALREVYGEYADVAQYLSLEPRFIDPALTSGLWLCDSLEDVAAIGINAVCLRNPNDWAGLGKCAAFICRFYFLVIVCPDPVRRAEMEEQVQRLAFPIPAFSVQDKAFMGCSSADEVKGKYGQKAIDLFLMTAKQLSIYGLLEVADIKPPDITKMEKVSSGIPALDRCIGGFLMGQVSIWTGRRGNGKSTLLGQLLQESIDQGYAVCAYSGELADWQFKYWSSLQAAGPAHISTKPDPRTGKDIAVIDAMAQTRIDDWWRHRFFLNDIGSESAHDEDRILSLFEYANLQYGAKVFLVDNIMTANFRKQSDTDFYRAQSNFVGRLLSFAKRRGVHIHVVAHPRKANANGGKHITNDDVGGIGDITNRADNVFSLEREPCEERGHELGEITVLSVLKNRMYGEKVNVGLNFDPRSKRFYKHGHKPDKKYAWDLCGEQVELPRTSPVPFE